MAQAEWTRDQNQSEHSRRSVLDALRRQLDICSKLNEDLVSQTKLVDTSINEMDHQLKPVTNMWDTVAASTNNINKALEQIESVCV